MNWVSEAIGSFFFSLACYRIVCMMFGLDSTVNVNVSVEEVHVRLDTE
jgi:hypothetical protein